jgi:hypothetical protein
MESYESSGNRDRTDRPEAENQRLGPSIRLESPHHGR